jgi:hypothetical protein
MPWQCSNPWRVCSVLALLPSVYVFVHQSFRAMPCDISVAAGAVCLLLRPSCWCLRVCIGIRRPVLYRAGACAESVSPHSVCALYLTVSWTSHIGGLCAVSCLPLCTNRLPWAVFEHSGGHEDAGSLVLPREAASCCQLAAQQCLTDSPQVSL